MKPPAISTDLGQLDAYAWKAICEWSSRLSDRNTCFNGDYIQLTRWFLWDKVGRAIRFSCCPGPAIFEKMLIDKVGIPAATCSTEVDFCRRYLRQYLSRIRNLVKKDPENPACKAHNFQRRSGPLVYVPVLSDRLTSATVELIHRNICQVVVGCSPRPLEGAGEFKPIIKSHPDYSTATSLYKAIISGLKGFGITLFEGDAQLLRSQVLLLTAQVNSVNSELELLKPDAILVHGDNHPPFQAYVLAARKMGIPSIMLQHGLDCEDRYLDEAYASAIAVWGPERERRYRERSTFQPRISVTGNPEYDHLRTPRKIDTAGNNWLWVTRPHSPEKCYAPSRSPVEGVSILYSLIEALQKAPGASLVIKSHPYDYCDQYAQVIADQGMQERIALSALSVHDLFPLASLVVTEDSSAGLDAMFAGKPLIHAHFAENRPTMPFVDYGAALPGFSSDQLVDSVLRAEVLGEVEAQIFLRGQINFVQDFAGLCDGEAGKRFVDFVEEILC